MSPIFFDSHLSLFSSHPQRSHGSVGHTFLGCPEGHFFLPLLVSALRGRKESQSGSHDAIRAVRAFLVKLAHPALPSTGQAFFVHISWFFLFLLTRSQEETKDNQTYSYRYSDEDKSLYFHADLHTSSHIGVLIPWLRKSASRAHGHGKTWWLRVPKPHLSRCHTSRNDSCQMPGAHQ